MAETGMEELLYADNIMIFADSSTNIKKTQLILTKQNTWFNGKQQDKKY